MNVSLSILNASNAFDSYFKGNYKTALFCAFASGACLAIGVCGYILTCE